MTLNYTYDSANRLTGVDGMPYTWDANGNLLSDGVSTYTYNHANQLTGVAQGAANYSFAYDGLGNRLRQITGANAVNYVLDISGGLTQVLADGTNTYLYGLERIAQGSTSGMEYYLGDALGSVRQMADASGGLTLSRNYEPYGTAYAAMGSASTAYGFTGEWTDGTGLIYLRTRYYTPWNDRFVNVDPWNGDQAQPISYNKWLYVDANPINLTDPNGLCSRGDFSCLQKAQELYRDYGWQIDEFIQENEIDIILDAAKVISRIFNRHGGDGQARMRGAMSPVWFTHAYFLWTLAFPTYHHVEEQTVYMIPGFDSGAVIHEMGHILDNLTGDSIYASIYGGGPSDEMARHLGVDPSQCFLRFSCPKYAGLLKDVQAEPAFSSYALTGPSEDFAETFEYLVINESVTMQQIPIRSEWMINYISQLSKSRNAYTGQPYHYLWFIPQPIPAPECVLPQSLKTPQP